MFNESIEFYIYIFTFFIFSLIMFTFFFLAKNMCLSDGEGSVSYGVYVGCRYILLISALDYMFVNYVSRSV